MLASPPAPVVFFSPTQPQGHLPVCYPAHAGIVGLVPLFFSFSRGRQKSTQGIVREGERTLFFQLSSFPKSFLQCSYRSHRTACAPHVLDAPNSSPGAHPTLSPRPFSFLETSLSLPESLCFCILLLCLRGLPPAGLSSRLLQSLLIRASSGLPQKFW